MKAGFQLSNVDKAAPFILGSLQDATAMQFVYQGAPFVVAGQGPGAMYQYDVRGRLTQVRFTNETTIDTNLDAMGNRTSVVSTCGPHGC